MKKVASARLRRTGRVLRPAVLVTGALSLVLVAPTSMAAGPAADAASVHDPVDPGDWVNPDDTTWADYRAIPDSPAGWVDGSIDGTEREFKAAVVLVDFENQPMLLTQEAGAHVFGNPQEGWEPLQRDEVAGWWEDYLSTPNEYNEGHTINEYWMENSNGRYSVDIDAFGPYQLPGKLHEYGLQGYAPVTGPNSVCPAGDTCTKNIRTDGFTAWYGDQGADIYEEYDVLFWVTAGHDESGTWQEFGEMKFQTPEDVPAEFGPPGATEGTVYNAAGNPIPNWAPTRYIGWTSWAAAANHWPNAQGGGVIPNSTQAESSGQSIFQHEMSHLLGIGDNYNNPFGNPTIRTYSGHWDMLSRGTFNGPGGTHERWMIPNQGASGMGSQFSLRNKLKLNMVEDEQVVRLTTEQLATDGLARATVSARSVNRSDRLAGFNVTLSGGDQSSCAASGLVGDRAWLCDRGGFNNYALEVVDRMGMDSFTPSSGVHLAKTKNQDRAPFIWSIDANPEDIGWVDFLRPDGTPAMVSLGDPRQLQDALFRAGTGSGSQYEYVDEANRLHFYVLERVVDDSGVLTYDVAVRALDGAGAQARGVTVGSTTAEIVEAGTTATLSVPVTNTGAAGSTSLHSSDVYRVETTLAGDGWTVTQPYEVVAVAAGETRHVPLHLAHAGGGAATVTVTITSESDPSASQTVQIDVQSVVVAAARADLAELIEAGALPPGPAAQMTAFLDQVADAISKGKVKQAEMALDRIEQRLKLVDDPAHRTVIQDYVTILRQS